MKQRVTIFVAYLSIGLFATPVRPWEIKPNPSWLMLQSTEKPSQEYPTLKMWGLIGAMYSSIPNNSFSLRRGYLGVRGSWVEKVDYFILTDFGTGVVGKTSPLLLDASLTLKHIPYLKMRFGQFKIPFGLEGLEAHFAPPLINFTKASVQLMSFSAPLALSTSTRTSSNSAFRDIGVQLFDEINLTKDIQTVYALGLFNGNGVNSLADDNDSKDLSTRLETSTRGFRVGTSAIFGKATQDRLSKNRFGVDATYNIGPLHLGGEWILAEDQRLSGRNHKASGWHLRASYLITDRLQPVFRYEEFEPNADVLGDNFRAVAVGLNWIFKGYTRMQLNYEFRKDEANPSLGDLLTGQVQVVF